MSFKAELAQKVQKSYQKKLKEKLALDRVQDLIRSEVHGLFRDLEEYTKNGLIYVNTTVYDDGEFSVIEMGEDKLVFKRESSYIAVELNEMEMDFLTFNSIEVVSKHFEGQRFSIDMVAEYIKQAFRTTLGF